MVLIDWFSTMQLDDDWLCQIRRGSRNFFVFWWLVGWLVTSVRVVILFVCVSVESWKGTEVREGRGRRGISFFCFP